MSKTPINDFVNEYIDSDMTRFHMPGHKGRNAESFSSATKTVNFLERDITEIQGADSLYEAGGIIEESECFASEFFGSYRTFFSVEGSSQVIKAMLALVSSFDGESKTVLAARNVHRSFISAAALLDLQVEWLYSEDEKYSLCSCPVSGVQVKAAIERLENKPCAVYLTSPDYLGGMQDIKEIAKVTHQAGIPLLVDNAHGAYLHFLETPLHPLDLGADMCCDSAHKTLPCATGCAYLHIGSSNISWAKAWEKNARRALSLFGSTSPSYLLLQSLDSVNGLLENGLADKIKSCVNKVGEVKQTIRSLGWKLKEDRAELETEPMKIVLDTAAMGIKGNELARVFRDFGIECEYVDPDYLVLMPTPSNSERDYERLLTALEHLNRCDNADLLIQQMKREELTFVKPERAMGIREAMFAQSEEVAIDASCGRILSDSAIGCPPAVPLIVCGEIIPEGADKLFAHYGIKTVNVVR